MNRSPKSKRSRRKYWRETRPGGNGTAIATYARNSKGNPRGASTAAQEKQHEPVIQRLNPSIVHHYIDKGISGTDFNTRQINEILAKKQSGELTVLLCSNIDRLGREVFGFTRFVIDFAMGGGSIVTPDKTFDCTKLDDFAELLERIISACRQLASTSKYTEMAIIEHWNSGEYSKRVPYAYIRRKDRWIQRVPELVPVVRKIYVLYKKTGNLNAVRRLVLEKYGRCLKAIERKYPQLKGKLNLSDDRIRTILTDPVYIGRPVNRGVVRVDPSLRMVSENFKACQKILRRNDQKRTPPNERGLNKAIAENPIIALKIFGGFIDTKRLYHLLCNGKLGLHGNTRYRGNNQSIVGCEKCKTEIRLPNSKHWRRIKQNTICSICGDEIKEAQSPVVCGNCTAMVSKSFSKNIDRVAGKTDGGNRDTTVLTKEVSSVKKAKCKAQETKEAHIRRNVSKSRNDSHKRTATILVKCAMYGELVTKAEGHYSGKFAHTRRFYCNNCYNMLNMRIVKEIKPTSYRGAYRIKRSLHFRRKFGRVARH